MSSYEKVIVGIDGSDVAKHALAFAADEADRRGCRLVAVHAGDLPVEGWPKSHAIEVHSFAEIIREEAVALVAATHPHVQFETVVQEADPAHLLVQLSNQADLLVVGTHRMGRLRGFVLGSVSQSVAAHAACPVITISGPSTHSNGPIVLGASSSPGGLAAMRFACEQARRLKVAVHAIRAVSVEDWALIGFGYPMAMSMESLEASAKAHLSTVLAKAKTEFPDVVITGTQSSADAFVALLEATKDASLMVLGSRRGEDAMLSHLGPIAAWLLHQAQSPIAIVPFLATEQPTTAARVEHAAAPA